MLTRAKAIRAKCLDCCCGNTAEVRKCHIVKCPLFPYRMGRKLKDDNLSAEDDKEEKTTENAYDFEDEEDVSE